MNVNPGGVAASLIIPPVAVELVVILLTSLEYELSLLAPKWKPQIDSPPPLSLLAVLRKFDMLL